MKCHKATHEINELLRISQRILQYGEEPGFRKINVICKAKTGETVRFASPEDIPSQLLGLMNKFYSMLEMSEDLETTAKSFSIFWLGLISIHPFVNGNGRTGKLYLQKKAQEKGLNLSRIDILDSILLLGDLQRDLSLLYNYFLSNLTYQRTNL